MKQHQVNICPTCMKTVKIMMAIEAVTNRFLLLMLSGRV